MLIRAGDKFYLQGFLVFLMVKEFGDGIPGCPVNLEERIGGKFCEMESIKSELSFMHEFSVLKDALLLDFLESADFVYDFSEYSSKTLSELYKIRSNILVAFSKEVEAFDNKPQAYQKARDNDMRIRFVETRLKCEQLKFLIACKEGNVQFPALPVGAIANTKAEHISFWRRLWRKLFDF